MIGARFHRDADKGTRQIDAAVRHHRSLRGEIVERLARQNDDVGGFTIAQAVHQPKRRREIAIDAHAAFRLISPGKAANRPPQGKRRKQANNVFHRQSPVAAWPAALAMKVKSANRRVLEIRILKACVLKAVKKALNGMIRQNAKALWRIRLRPGRPSGPGRGSLERFRPLPIWRSERKRSS